MISQGSTSIFFKKWHKSATFVLFLSSLLQPKFPTLTTTFMFRQSLVHSLLSTQMSTDKNCCPRDQCQMPTRVVTFDHHCSFYKGFIHAICDTTDDNDVTMCPWCLLTRAGHPKKRTRRENPLVTAMTAGMEGRRAQMNQRWMPLQKRIQPHHRVHEAPMQKLRKKKNFTKKKQQETKERY